MSGESGRQQPRRRDQPPGCGRLAGQLDISTVIQGYQRDTGAVDTAWQR
ncbi:MAG: hypothetical protein R3C44_13720 [Chloroflexota bacterium]